jgi:hypothetical protein
MPDPNLPTDFASLIDYLGGPVRMRDFVSVNRRVPYAWRANNWIPSDHWRPIAKAAKDSGFEGITYALLASFPRPARASDEF